MSSLLKTKKIWPIYGIYSEEMQKHQDKILLSLTFFILLLIQAAPFMKGYRLTADDVSFHYFAMDGWSAAWDFIKAASFGQGRFVHFVDLPFSLLGSYFADNYIFRAFYTGLYFSNFALMGCYVSLLLFGRYLNQIVILITLILISFHPLDYYHLAPNAYPFHLSLPVFLILLSRMKLWLLRDLPSSPFSWVESVWLTVFFGGMIFSEYGFIFGVSLLLAEYFVRTLRTATGEKRFLRVALEWRRDRRFLQDGLLVTLFLALYFGFRMAYPSHYDGNKISADFDIGMFAKTLLGHIYGGTSIASFDRYGALIFRGINNFHIKDYFFLIVVFLGTYFVLRRCIIEIISNRSLDLSRTQLIIPSAIGIFVALFITIPFALTAKYQSWCTKINTCIYLDSRISFLGIGICIFSMLMYVLARKTRSSKSITLASVSIALIAVVSYVNNKRISIDMGDYSSAWDMGKKISCSVTEDMVPWTLSSLVDPLRRITYHYDFDVEDYWIQYIKDQKKNSPCEQSVPISSFFPIVTLGEPMLFQKGSEDLRYLLSGWSIPESWGIWSDSSSSIFFPISPKLLDSISIDFNVLISPSHPLQRVEVIVNGVLSSSLRVTELSRIVEVEIPEAAKLDSFSSVKLEFRLPDAVSPKNIGLSNDDRTLGLGLKAITLR